MAGLTQKRFAALLAAGLTGMDLTAAEVSRITARDGRRAKIARDTIGDYLIPSYPSGPPKRETRARLERAIGLPEGYLDGDLEIDLADWRKRSRQGLVGSPADIVMDPALGSGASLGQALAFVREQLEGYRSRGKPVPPTIVAAWLAELEAAATARPAPTADDAAAESGPRATG